MYTKAELDRMRKMLKRCNGKKEMHTVMQCINSPEGKLITSLFTRKSNFRGSNGDMDIHKIGNILHYND